MSPSGPLTREPGQLFCRGCSYPLLTVSKEGVTVRHRWGGKSHQDTVSWAEVFQKLQAVGMEVKLIERRTS